MKYSKLRQKYNYALVGFSSISNMNVWMDFFMSDPQISAYKNKFGVKIVILQWKRGINSGIYDLSFYKNRLVYLVFLLRVKM